MPQTKLNVNINNETPNSGWKSLYKSGGAAALIMVLIILIQFIVFIVWPPPSEGSVLDWFMLFQDNPFRGLMSFELLMVVYTILSVPIILALTIALRRVNQSFTLIYLALSIIGIMSFITARPAFEMLSLSSQYAAAATDAQRAMFLASGSGMLAVFEGTAFQVSYILGSVAGLIISVVMLKSDTFRKTTAYIRIISSVLDFGLFIPGIGIYISMLSVVFLIAWHILIAGSLFKLSRNL